MIYHKNLQRVAYVFAETAGRPPADVVVDVLADRSDAPAPPSDVKRVGNGWLADRTPRPVEERTFFSNGSGIAWCRTARIYRRFCRRRGMEDHPGRVPRSRPGLRGRDDRHLHPAGGADGVVHGPDRRHARHSADHLGRHARLLAAQRRERSERGRLSRPGLFHRHRHDRHDRSVGNRDPRLDHPGRLHPSFAEPGGDRCSTPSWRAASSVSGRSC